MRHKEKEKEKNTRSGKLRLYAGLFLTMLEIGLFSFGGGYGMIALVENEFVDRKKWIGKEEFTDMIAIAESTPGPVAINSATYIGYTLAGTGGAVTATVAVCIPSFLIIYLISLFFDAFLSLKYVERAFRGIQVCVTFLILTAGLKLLKSVRKTPLSLCIFGGTLTAVIACSLLAVNFSSVFYVLIGAAAGLFGWFVTRLKKRDVRTLPPGERAVSDPPSPEKTGTDGQDSSAPSRADAPASDAPARTAGKEKP